MKKKQPTSSVNKKAKEKEVVVRLKAPGVILWAGYSVLAGLIIGFSAPVGQVLLSYLVMYLMAR